MDDLALALELADAADAVTLPRFVQRSFTTDWKANRTVVTEADLECESEIARLVAAARPEHGFYGEEHGTSGSTDSRWQWIVDPIDGTSNYARGVPVWATLIALADKGDIVTAVVSAPALGARWWASRGIGAFNRDRRLAVSTVDSITDAQVSVTFSQGWEDAGLTPSLVALASSAHRARGFGDFWQHMLVAEGAIDVAVDAIGVMPYDLAAVSLIVTEAGGRFTDRHGTPTYRNDSAVSTNAVLHDAVIASLT